MSPKVSPGSFCCQTTTDDAHHELQPQAAVNATGDAIKLEREAFGEGHNWYLRMWIDSIPTIVARCEWDVQSVARNLITTLPAPLRVRCPGYPGMEDGDAFSAAAVAVAGKIGNEVKDSKRCKDPDAITIGRLALEAMGYEGARHLRLFRPSND